MQSHCSSFARAIHSQTTMHSKVGALWGGADGGGRGRCNGPRIIRCGWIVHWPWHCTLFAITMTRYGNGMSDRLYLYRSILARICQAICMGPQRRSNVCSFLKRLTWTARLKFGQLIYLGVILCGLQRCTRDSRLTAVGVTCECVTHETWPKYRLSRFLNFSTNARAITFFKHQFQYSVYHYKRRYQNVRGRSSV